MKSFTFLSFYMYYGNSSCWLIFLTIYSPISFSLSSLTHIFVVHQYADVSRLFINADVPWMCTAIPTNLCWNCRGTFKPVVHFCISLLKAHSGYNCQDQHLGLVQLLRGREWKGASANGFCGPVRVCILVARSKIVQRRCTIEIWRSSSEVTGPEFTPSRSYKYICQQREICAGFVPHYAGLSCRIWKKYVQYPQSHAEI